MRLRIELITLFVVVIVVVALWIATIVASENSPPTCRVRSRFESCRLR